MVRVEGNSGWRLPNKSRHFAVVARWGCTALVKRHNEGSNPFDGSREMLKELHHIFDKNFFYPCPFLCVYDVMAACHASNVNVWVRFPLDALRSTHIGFGNLAVNEGFGGSIPLDLPMNANAKFLKEARELEKNWSSTVFKDIDDRFIRGSSARLLESHRLPGEVKCQECEELASYSRFLEKPSPVTNNFHEYFCLVHAPNDATCFVVEAARHKFK
jgi:hypothetical protein